MLQPQFFPKSEDQIFPIYYTTTLTMSPPFSIPNAYPYNYHSYTPLQPHPAVPIAWVNPESSGIRSFSSCGCKCHLACPEPSGENVLPIPSVPGLTSPRKRPRMLEDTSAPSQSRDVGLSNTDRPSISKSPSVKKPTKTRLVRSSDDDKLDSIFSLLTQYRWSIGHLLYHIFRVRSKDETVSQQRIQSISRFLTGECTYGPGIILDAWFRSPYGAVKAGSKEEALMFNTETPYMEIKSVRPAMSSFAAQLVQKQLGKEAERAVQPGNGLNVFSKTESSHHRWADMGTTTVSGVMDSIKKHQPLTWHCVTTIASAKARKRNGVIEVRHTRPMEYVT